MQQRISWHDAAAATALPRPGGGPPAATLPRPGGGPPAALLPPSHDADAAAAAIDQRRCRQCRCSCPSNYRRGSQERSESLPAFLHHAVLLPVGDRVDHSVYH
ncbi:uncharacterized protein LOC124130683 isoform X1 [Haliotis rufescens]|uniref:uncharacterized protein LOC124130683 isoform X1 n=1 Tax=Haliotis rufescens TaxID=6454 RepID=UPI001EB0A8B7|nr:uncharacterized protein LOC124130683 isoform X1 [Haliotis rufescens]